MRAQKTGKVAYLLTHIMKIISTSDTFLKALPVPAAQLKEKDLPHQLVQISSGSEFEIVDCQPYDNATDTAEDDHLFIQLKDALNGHKGIRWFVPSADLRIEGTELGNDPKDSPAPPIAKAQDFGPKISIPGISRAVGIYEPVYFEPTVSNFTWSEMTKGGTRIPINPTITYRIVKLCKYLDEVRTFLGSKPIRVTSGYRDPISNRRVGGARSSRHMAGDAVDFWVEGMDVVDVFYKLKNYHKTGGLAVGNGFVHLDMRPGTPARWTYPGGPQVALW